MKQFSLTKTKLFHFHRMFKNGGGGREGVRTNPHEPPLDPPAFELPQYQKYVLNTVLYVFGTIKLEG